MGNYYLTKPLGLLYLVISGHVLIDCRRVATSTLLQAEDANGEEVSHAQSQAEWDAEHPWCNPFSSLPTRSYHFDVELSDKQCRDGNCMAIELVRHKSKPTLQIHVGQSWLIQKGSDGLFQWDLYPPDGNEHKKMHDNTIDLMDVHVVKFLPADKKRELPDALEIDFGVKGDSPGKSTREVFVLEGGLYYDPDILNQGFEKLSHEDFKQMEDNATQESHYTKGRRVGRLVGATGSVLTVGGFYTAATLTGVAVQTQALVGAALLGVVGGAMGGAILGGVVGLGIAAGAFMMGSTRVYDFEITAASRKIFEKLRCIPDFKSCDTNILVPANKDCPRTP